MMLHPPQCRGFSAVFTLIQTPEQQFSPGAQVRPQLPQLFTSATAHGPKHSHTTESTDLSKHKMYRIESTCMCQHHWTGSIPGRFRTLSNNFRNGRGHVLCPHNPSHRASWRTHRFPDSPTMDSLDLAHIAYWWGTHSQSRRNFASRRKD